MTGDNDFKQGRGSGFNIEGSRKVVVVFDLRSDICSRRVRFQRWLL